MRNGGRKEEKITHFCKRMQWFLKIKHGGEIKDEKEDERNCDGDLSAFYGCM